MTCQECEFKLGMEEDVHEHLAMCKPCRELADELRANAIALRDLANDPLPGLLYRRRARWEWPLAAAAMLALGFGLSRRFEVQQLPPLHIQVAASAPKIEIPPVPPVVRRIKPLLHRETTAPLMVKMFTSDPDVVIYWLIETKEGTE